MNKKSKKEPTVENQTVTIKLKNHPNEWKYCGRANSEYKIEQLKHLSSLSESEIENLSNIDELCYRTMVEEFHKSLQIEDEVGVGYNLYKIKEINDDGFLGSIKQTNKDSEVSLKDIDRNIGFGFAEILKRNGVPYNTKTSMEVNLKIIEEQPNVKQSKSKPVHKRTSRV